MASKKKAPRSRVLPESVSEAMNANSSVNGGDTPFGGSSDGGGTVQSRNIANCDQARALVMQLVKENQLRAQSFAQLRNQVEGGRPFDPAELRKNGEQGRTNCNFNDARAALKRAILPYWKMVNEVPRKMAITVHSRAPDAYRWGMIMAEAADRFFDDWADDYFREFEGCINDMVMFGPAFPMFQDAETPRYTWARFEQLLFPRRTKASVGKFELVALRREMTASELLAKIRDQKERDTSYKAGWNPKAVEQAIKNAAPESIQGKWLDPTYWQDMIVNNDMVINEIWPPVCVVDVWAREKTGEISHYILTEKIDTGDYLYSSTEEATEFKQIFRPLFYDVGSNGLVHGIKGFGVMNYYYMTVINRMKCKAADAVNIGMSLTFTKEDDTPDEAPPMQQWSMFNLLPKGITQVPIYPTIQPAQALMESLTQNQNENNYTYNDAGTQQNIASTDTKGQADLIASISSEGQTAQAAIFLSQMAQVFTEILARLSKKSSDPDAKNFRRRCIELGLPEEVLDERFEKTVKCGASPTMASPAIRTRIGQQLMSMANQPGMNFRAIQEFNVANLTGAEGVTTFMQPIGVNSDPRARREAMMENVDMGNGIPLPVDPNDAHAEHAEEHIKPLEAITQMAQQGMNPQQVPGQPMNPAAQITPEHLVALQVGIPHVNDHMQYLALDDTKAPIFKQLNARLKMVENVAGGIMARLARSQRNGGDPAAAQQAIGQPRQ